MHKEHSDTIERRLALALGNAQNRNKHHHRNAVIKQRLASNLGGKAGGSVQRFENRHHRYRISGRHHGTKQQAVDKGQRNTQPAQHVPHGTTDQEGREHNAQGGQQRHEPLLVRQLIQVHMKGPGKQQKAEQTIKQRRPQIGLANQMLCPVGHTAHTQVVKPQQYDRKHQ